MRFVYRFFEFIFYDQARPLEVLSAVNLLSWAGVFLANPELLARDSYRSFEALDARVWAAIFAATAVAQFIGMIGKFLHAANMRFVGMALASGAWTVVAANFVNSGVSTTANTNYVLLAVLCAMAGAFLGWKSKH